MGIRNAGQSEGVDAAGVADAVISALNTGTSVLSRIKASAAEALTDAGVATVSAIIPALDTGTSILSRIKASAASAIADAVTANSIPSDADVAAVPAATATALNTGTSVLSRVVASAADALTTAGIPAATVALLDEVMGTSLTRVVASCTEALQNAGLAVSGTSVYRNKVTSGAGVAGPMTLIADPGDGGIFYDVELIIISTKTANCDFELKMPGYDFGVHTLLQNSTVVLSKGSMPRDGEGCLMRVQGGALTMDKTTGSAVSVTVIGRTNEV